MPKKWLRLTSLLLLTAILVNSFSAAAFAENGGETALFEPVNDVEPIKYLGEVYPEDVNEYIPQSQSGGLMAYSVKPDWLTQRCSTLYSCLAGQENGELMQELYDRMYNVFVSFTMDENGKYTFVEYQGGSGNFISINLSGLENLFITSDNTLDITAVGDVYYALIQDNPQFFYLGGSYTIAITGNAKYYFIVELDADYLTAEQRIKEADAITASIEGYDAIINKNMSNYAIEKKVHDKLCQDNKYAYDSDGNPSTARYAHSIAGSLNSEYGGGVCESYAKAFKLLLNRYEVPCYYAAGTANGGGHAWNYVQLDNGSYYCVDVTWDDQDTSYFNYYYRYFNMPNSDFHSNREATSTYMHFVEQLPDCADNSDYYTASYGTVIIRDGMRIGQAPDVSEDGTRELSTTTTAETTTESTTSASVFEGDIESTTCDLQIIANSSVKYIIIKEETAGWNVNQFSNTKEYILVSTQEGSEFSVAVAGECTLSYKYQSGSESDYLSVYLDDTLIGSYSATGTYTVQIPEGLHRVRWIHSSYSSHAIVYSLSAIDKGDINADGQVDLKDAMELLGSNIDTSNLSGLDINGDGIVGSEDCAYILRRIIKESQQTGI